MPNTKTATTATTVTAETAEVTSLPAVAGEIIRAIPSSGKGNSAFQGRTHQDLGFLPVVIFPGSGKDKAPDYRLTAVVKGKFKGIGALWLQEDGRFGGTCRRADEEYPNEQYLYDLLPEVTDEEVLALTAWMEGDLLRVTVEARQLGVTAEQLGW